MFQGACNPLKHSFLGALTPRRSKPSLCVLLHRLGLFFTIDKIVLRDYTNNNENPAQKRGFCCIKPMNTFIFALTLMNSVSSSVGSTAPVAPVKVPEPVKMTVIATAYTPRPEETDSTPWLTAAGTKTREGIIAANWLPFGTKIKIDDKIYTVEDRMNARYTAAFPARIDIVFMSLAKARKFGKQKIEIEIMPDETNPLGIVS